MIIKIRYLKPLWVDYKVGLPTKLMGYEILLLVFLRIFGGVFFSTCTQNTSETAEQASGEALSKRYCGTCHLYPTPDLLPKSIWKQYVLPQMGQQLGIYAREGARAELLAAQSGADSIIARRIFPEKPLLSPSEWQKIQDFYLQQAPDTLSRTKTLPVQMGLAYFEPQKPGLKCSPPSTTLAKIRPQGGLWLGDANSKRLYWSDAKLEVENAANLAEGIVHIQANQKGMYVTMMGQFSPTDEATGMVIYLPNGSPQAQIMLEGLQRPVHSAWADFNQDGLEDAVVCEFAKWTGGLSYWQQRSDGTFNRTILRQRPGAVSSYIRDWNQDGHPDIISLFAQGDEGIFVYLNNGKGYFTEQAILRFPPTYGSSAFRLVDWNKDGREDILHICGDNADYKPILKPYHGIQLYIQDEKGAFQQDFFYPMYGAYDAIPADFDDDGDLDLAAISFFPDFTAAAPQSFLLLDNQGDGQFHPSTFPEMESGRWMVMDAGDIDLDGDLDLILGSLTFEVVPDGGQVARWVKGGLPYIVLKNKTK